MWSICVLSFVCYFLCLQNVFAADCYSEFCRNETRALFKDGPKCILTPTLDDFNCMNFKFPPVDYAPPPGIPAADLKLSAYLTKREKITSFNLTIPEITFRALYTRYQDLEDIRSSYCRRIKFYDLFKSVDKPSLYVDCPFNDISFEGSSYQLEYLIVDDDYQYSRKLLFNVPYHYDIDENTKDVTSFVPFVYVDVSSISVLTLNIQQLPRVFNVSDYRVWVFNNESTKVQIVDLRADNPDDHIRHNFSVVTGQHTFYVAAMHPSCGPYGCRNGTLPAINVNLPARKLLIMIISVVWIPPVILYAIYSAWKLYQRKGLLKRLGRRPKCLLVYSPSHIAHVDVVTDLARFLRSCHVDAMLDVLDIPETVTKDPGHWCNEAFKAAEIIIVLASPSLSTASVPIIYRNVDNHALRLLKENYCLRNKRYIAIDLPYCKSEEIPEEARLFKRFKIPEGLDKLVKYIHKFDFVRCFGGSKDAILQSIKVASMEIPRERQNSPKNVNETDGLLPIKEKTIILNVNDEKSVDLKADNADDDRHEIRYYSTNIDELNLLGEKQDVQRDFDFRTKINDNEFHIDQLTL